MIYPKCLNHLNPDKTLNQGNLMARLEGRHKKFPPTLKTNKEGHQDPSNLNKHLRANKQNRFQLKVKCLNLKWKHDQAVIQHLKLCQNINSHVLNK